MTMTGPMYCDTSDVVALVTSFNYGGTPGDIDPLQVEIAIRQASAKVSSWTEQAWGKDNAGKTVPVPDIIQSITMNIAVYYATLTYRKNAPMNVADPVVLRYQDALNDLKAIANAEIDPNPVTPDQPYQTPGIVRNTNYPTFTLYDSGTRLVNGRIEPDGDSRAGGLSR